MRFAPLLASLGTIPSLVALVCLITGTSMGAEYIGDPGEGWIRYGYLATLPSGLGIVMLMPPPMGAGNDLYEVEYLAPAIFLALIVNPAVGYGIGRLVDHIRAARRSRNSVQQPHS